MLFVCRQMASCLLKKSLEERTQKVVPQQALHSFQQFGSFIPLRTFVRMQRVNSVMIGVVGKQHSGHWHSETKGTKTKLL